MVSSSLGGMLSKLTKISTAPDRLFEVMCCFSTVVRSEGTGTGRIHPSNSSDSRAMAATAAPEAQASAAVKTWATCTSITWAQTRLEFHICCMPSHGISVYKWKNNIQKSRKIMETNQIQCNYTWELNCVKNICCFRNFWFWVQTTIMFVFEHFFGIGGTFFVARKSMISWICMKSVTEKGQSDFVATRSVRRERMHLWIVYIYIV